MLKILAFSILHPLTLRVVQIRTVFVKILLVLIALFQRLAKPVCVHSYHQWTHGHRRYTHPFISEERTEAGLAPIASSLSWILRMNKKICPKLHAHTKSSYIWHEDTKLTTLHTNLQSNMHTCIFYWQCTSM